MKLEVLVASMYSSPSLYDEMNIQTDAIIINQCDNDDSQVLSKKEKTLKFLSYNERGVGNSRNHALDNATGDILLFADDDVVYKDGYEQIVINTFNRNPNADAVIFNINTTGGVRDEVQVSLNGQMNFKTALAFGAVRLAVKREKIDNIRFSLLFGGGAVYGSGEDTVFIQDLFKSGLKVYGCTDVICDVNQAVSSWFDGYNDKYFFDKGALYSALWGKKAKFLSMITAARWCRKLHRGDYFHILGLYFKGIDDYKNRYGK